MFNLIDEPLDLSSLQFTYIPSDQLDRLEFLEPESFDVVIGFTEVNEAVNQLPFKFNPQIHEPYLKRHYNLLESISKVATKTATLYLYGLQQWLPYFAVHLDQHNWGFKYWLALETSHPVFTSSPMIPTHEGILLYVRSKKKFSLRKVRSPHQMCDVCGDYVADWGGKKHLRNPAGYAISDVWDDLPQVKDQRHILSKEVWQRLILLTAQENSRILCVAYDGVADIDRFIFE